MTIAKNSLERDVQSSLCTVRVFTCKAQIVRLTPVDALIRYDYDILRDQNENNL